MRLLASVQDIVQTNSSSKIYAFENLDVFDAALTGVICVSSAILCKCCLCDLEKTKGMTCSKFVDGYRCDLSSVS